MNTPSAEPEGHQRPYYVMQLLAPGLIDPKDRRVAMCLLVVMGVLWSLVSMLLAWDISWWDIPYAFFMIGLCVSLIPVLDWSRRRADPEATLLAQTEEGRSLLREGQELRERRDRLKADSSSTFPILAVAPTERKPTDPVTLAWREQIRLEHDLRERQDTYLRARTTTTAT